MPELKNRWKDKRSNFEIFLHKMYDKYVKEKRVYGEYDILSEYEYHKKYSDFLHFKYKEQNIS